VTFPPPLSLAEKLDEILERLRRLEESRAGWLSIHGAAAHTSLSASLIRRAVRSGSLPCANLSSVNRPLYRISRADLDAWLEARKRTADPVRAKPVSRFH
jgi:excisionase family DNA binding protein